MHWRNPPDVPGLLLPATRIANCRECCDATLRFRHGSNVTDGFRACAARCPLLLQERSFKAGALNDAVGQIQTSHLAIEKQKDRIMAALHALLDAICSSFSGSLFPLPAPAEQT